MELNPGHRRHLDVGDQTGRFPDAGEREEVGRRRKNGYAIAQRPYEPSHRLPKRLIVVDDRDQ